jgi:hypothetical protein
VSPRPGLNKEQLDNPASDSDAREAERLAALVLTVRGMGYEFAEIA